VTFEQAIEIESAPSALFALTQDYERRLAWDPFLRSAELIDGAEAPAVGVRAWCVARTGLGMETEYIADDPARVAAVRMTRGPWFFRQFAGTWRFDEAEAGRTRVRFRYHLQARPRWLTGLLARRFARDTRQRLTALRAFAESERFTDARDY
jgi:ribosome-associated toxin RatA of RatAB toxin-antitoxin module